MAVDPDSSSPSPNKRLKTLATTSTFNSPFNVDSKANKLENSSQICVICLSEDGKADAGQLDCCDHYFCLVCIIEWGKIESKCPSCKRRFSTICRLPIDGSRGRVVKIPIRDQACHSSENLSGEHYDPYGHVRCNICNGMEDDSLMLLCDRCDSASHTYCVGLGTTVPEGDWFCRNCDINGRNASARSQTSLDGDDRISTSVETPPSIRDIVRKPNNLRLGTVIERVPSCPNNKATALVTSDRSNVSNDSRTLHRCRNIHMHIRALRENWHDLQRGSISFPTSSLTNSSNKKKLEVDPSTSTSCQNAESSKEERILGDVEKAWKMLKIAKATCESTSRVNPAVETPPGRQTNPKNACCTTANASVVGNQQYKRKDLVRTAVRNQGHWSSVNDELKRQSAMNDEHNRCVVARKENSESNKGNPPISSCSAEYKDNPCRENGTGSSRNSKMNDGNRRSGKDDVNIEETNIHDAKSEIQSLVKINLKLLSRDKRLGVDKFKKAARLATHTILAACGLEPWKLNSYSVPNSICNHEKDILQKLRKVSLMPNCCEECFYVVVQDIVKTGMEEKLGCSSKGSKH